MTQPMTRRISSHDVSFIDSDAAKAIDETLMSTPGFSIDQLMELAGLSVGIAANNFLTIDDMPSHDQNDISKSPSDVKKVLLLCGPGNNGGDGLVAARHLKHFGYFPSVIYSKQSKGKLFANLVRQCEDLGIPVHHDAFTSEELTEYASVESFDLIVDALFGFSFSGPARAPFTEYISFMTDCKIPVLSVDVPSGWNIEDGDKYFTGFTPEAVISLTAPKQCMKSFGGTHYVGGRFVPPNVQRMYELDLPDYGRGIDQVVLLDSLMPSTVEARNVELREQMLSDSSVTPVCEEPVAASKSAQAKPVRLPKPAHQPAQPAEPAKPTLYVSAPNVDVAKKFSKNLLSSGFAEIVELHPGVVRMNGKEVERGDDVLIIYPATQEALAQATRAASSFQCTVISQTQAKSIMNI